MLDAPVPVIRFPSLAFLFAAGATVAAPAMAAPWFEPGSRQLRQDVELLAAAGRLRGPINAWPLPLADLCGEVAPAGAADPVVDAAARRVNDACRRARQTTSVDTSLGVTNDPALIRDFGGGARAELDVSGRVNHRLGRLHLSLGVGYRSDQDGSDLHFEPSYLALDLGGWALYGGYVEHWWGPGHEQALLFSNNARPFPKLGIKRLTPRPIDLPVLKLLGPVGVEAFAGVLTEDRSDFDNPAVAGIRVAVSPVPGLEVGLNRGLQLCGEGRPCDAGTILDALLAFGNRDNTGTHNEPGNQIAGFDISYTRRFGRVTAQLYAEAEGEDENHFFVEQYGRLAGLDLTGPAGADGGTWSLRAEWANTLASKLFGTSRRYAGSLYNNFLYTEGFRFRRRAIGSSLDTDGWMATLAGAYTDAADRRFYASWRGVAVNRASRAGHALAPSRETFNLMTAGAELPLGTSAFKLEARVADDVASRAGRLPVSGQIEFSWRTAL
jgi:hypothetical protein